jgi:signal transduction histidine kinase
MKFIYCPICLLLLSLTCFSQTTHTPVLKINSLPAHGVVLDKGWRFHPGDDMDWANPGFNDSQWQAIDPMLDLHYLPQIRNKPIGWFRIRFRVDSSLLNKSLAIQVDQNIASEIYLNGKLLQQYGKVSANADEVKAYQPDHEPVGVLFEQVEQVIAIRFSVQENLPYISFHPYYKALEIRINDIPGASALEKFSRRFSWHNYIETGFFLFLSLIFLGIYLVYGKQKANLYFSLSTFSFGIGDSLYIVLLTSSDVAFTTYAAVACWLLLWVFYNMFFFLAIYSLFAPRKGFSFWLVICSLLVGAFFLFTNYQWTFILGLSLPVSIMTIELLRISLHAFRKSRRGVSIVIIGLVCYLIFLNIFILMLYGFLPDPAITPNYNLSDIIYRIYIGCVPISLSIYLAREYAFTGKELEQRLIEVQQLSEQTIAQEQEKRQILADQNEILEKQVAQRTSELNHQKEELQSTLKHLKDTQTQLIQAEKMASLGALTAGIAHEIQNPLNFINNFSEVNRELIAEMKQEIDEGNIDEVKAIAKDVEENEVKINHHGKRADAIVKGMLQHSRGVIGDRQPSDINELVEEHLRLAYHGYRAKDQSFNADISTDYDPNVEQLSIVPQEIGRVLLNLFSNAFYAVSEKKKQLSGTFEPVVSVSTQKKGDQVVITVSDNGMGMPQKVAEKVFQPFFTTKPTGEGTGLGLSLSYDIVTKGHGGEMRVESKEGEGTEFIFSLPLGM